MKIKMKFTKLIISLVLTFLCSVVFAQELKKPSKLEVFCPDYIKNPTNTWANDGSGKNSWQDYVMDKIHNKEDLTLTKTPWVVYSDRDNNATYYAAGSSAFVDICRYGKKA